MELGMQGRLALVTGASQGIGLATAIAMAREGADVAILARRSEELERAVEAIEQAAPAIAVMALEADVTSEEEVAAAVRRLRDLGGSPEILVNTVGIRSRGDFESMSAEHIWRTVGGNVASVLHTVRLVLPEMKRLGWGRIVNVSAVSGRQPTVGQFATNVGKTAVLGLTKNLSIEVAGSGVTVNCVLPGRIATKAVLTNFSSEERAARSSVIPMGRYGTPEEVASAIAFFCSGPASYITGTSLAVDGGLLQAVA